MKKLLRKFGLWLIDHSHSEPTGNKAEQHICVDVGHLWGTKFSKDMELKKPIKERIFCKRCGAYYTDVKYHKQ